MRGLFIFFLVQLFHLGFPQSFPDFKSLRFDEDFSFLGQDSSRNLYQNFKFMRLGNSNQMYNSLGGEIRYQYFNIYNEDWGDAPKDPDGYILSRLLFHSDLHFSKSFRLFAQVQGSGANGTIVSSL